MLTGFKVRLFSNDQYVLDKVLYSNFYRLKKLPPNSVVVDIGAHVGYFSLSCLLMGASKVYSYEPLKQNFEALIENTRDFREKVNVNNLAVMYHDGVLDVNIPPFDEKTKSYDLNQIEIEQVGKPFDRVPCFTLDTLLDTIPEDKVHLLKLSIGGIGELDILKHSKNLSKVTHVCGETSSTDVALFSSVIARMKELGFKTSWFTKTDEGTTIFIFSEGEAIEQFELYNKGEE